MRRLPDPSSVSAFVDRAVSTHDFLQGEIDLSPRNSQLIVALSTFVRATLAARPAEEVEAILADPRMQDILMELRRLTGQAEYEMECFCAEAFTGQTEVPPGLERYVSFENFIYRANYEALIDQELSALRWNTKRPPIDVSKQSIAFVGSGPLPMSAILLHLRTGLSITCIDNDERACRLGTRYIHHLAKTDAIYADLPNRIHYIHKGGEEHDYITHPIVFVASLVGDKDSVALRVQYTSDTNRLMVMRSAEGLSILLYEPYNCGGVAENYNIYLRNKTEPNAEAVNTSLVYRLPPGKMWMRYKIDRDLVPTRDGLDVVSQRPVRRWRTASSEAVI